MTSLRDFDIFKSKAFTGETRQRHKSTQVPVSSPQKAPSDTLALTGFAKSAARANVGIDEKPQSKIDSTVASDDLIDLSPVTPNVLEVRISRKHLNKVISEMHTPVPIQATRQRSKPIDKHGLEELDSSEDDVENSARPPYESARKRADKAAFSEW